MSVYVMSAVWAKSSAQGSCLLVLLAIADWADDEGMAYPSIAKLAVKARLSERQVQYCRAELVDVLRELSVDQQKGPHGTNRYSVLMDQLGLVKPTAPAQDVHPSDGRTEERSPLHPAGATGGTRGALPVAPEPSPDTSPDTSKSSGSAEPVAAKPKVVGNARVQAFVDEVLRQGGTWGGDTKGRDARAIKDSLVEPELIAQAYVGLLQHTWGNDWDWSHATAWYAIEHLGRYSTGQAKEQAEGLPKGRTFRNY